jgi:hypothetical protein
MTLDTSTGSNYDAVMGYSTDFEGSFKLDRPLSEAHSAYLKAFSSTRRMKRDPKKAAVIDDRVRCDAGLSVGVDGEFFVGGSGPFGQGYDASVLKHNDPPSTQPGLWCQWVPNEDGTAIEWDGSEKFYDYVEWIRYIVKSFIVPWGYMMNGRVTWRGEEHLDVGVIVVKNNVVSEHKGIAAMAKANEADGILADTVRITVDLPKQLLADGDDEYEYATLRIATLVRGAYRRGKED